jgi:hypothetical protein
MRCQSRTCRAFGNKALFCEVSKLVVLADDDSPHKMACLAARLPFRHGAILFGPRRGRHATEPAVLLGQILQIRRRILLQPVLVTLSRPPLRARSPATGLLLALARVLNVPSHEAQPVTHVTRQVDA